MAQQKKTVFGRNLFSKTYESKAYEFYLPETIETTLDFREIFNILRQAKSSDVVNIIINSYGGCLSPTIQLVNEMENTKAHVLTTLNGHAYSAASMVFLAGHQYAVYPLSTMMVHSISFSTGFSKMHEIEANSDFKNTYYKELMKTVYRHFLSKKEIKKVLEGKEIWLGCNEILDRAEKKAAKIEKKAAKKKEKASKNV